MADTLHSKIHKTHKHTDPFKAAELRGMWTTVDVLLAEHGDREQQLVNELLQIRRDLPTGPFAGQFRVRIGHLLNTLYGEGTAPKGVFDD